MENLRHVLEQQVEKVYKEMQEAEKYNPPVSNPHKRERELLLSPVALRAQAVNSCCREGTVGDYRH